MFHLRSVNVLRQQRLISYQPRYFHKSTKEARCSNGTEGSFVNRFWESIRYEFSKNKEFKNSLKEFRDEAKKLEENDAIKAAREKFLEIEKEAVKNSELFKDHFESIRGKVSEAINEAGKTEIAKKAGKISVDFTKTISETGQQLGKSTAFQTLSQVTSAVKNEINNQVIDSNVYQKPVKLRKRKESTINDDEMLKTIKIDDKTLHIELHKESKLYQSWQNFKNNNPYINKIFELKIQYDESDNSFIRLSRIFTNKLGSLTTGFFEKNELSNALTELCRIDPQFEQRQFLINCETDFIPNILEAMARNDLEILRDWCYEGPFNIFRTQIEELRKQNLYMKTEILDINNVDILSGKVISDQGPVLFITFQAQLITCVEDLNGNVIEGDPDKVFRGNYIWALCRDPNELDQKAAWKLLEFSMNLHEQFI